MDSNMFGIPGSYDERDIHKQVLVSERTIPAVPHGQLMQPKDVAKLIRKELKTKFPGAIFSVTCGGRNAYSEIYVKWINGFINSYVYNAIRKYDGEQLSHIGDMDDYKDQTVINQGSPYRADVCCIREISDDVMIKEAINIAKEQGIDVVNPAMTDLYNIKCKDENGHDWDLGHYAKLRLDKCNIF